MSQHNIIGSEAFDRKPFILLRSYRMAGSRRRRASTTMAYVVVALIALCIGAIVVALVMGPQLAEAQSSRAVTDANAPLAAPAVPGTSAAPTETPAQGGATAPVTATTPAPAA